MHFGPEWMRKQPTPSARPPQPDPQTGPPPAIAHINSNTVLPSGGSTYSAHVTPTAGATPENRDVAHPFRYSKEDMLRIYKETGGRSGLGLEVERWEGIVREVAADPVGLKDPGEADKKVGVFHFVCQDKPKLNAMLLAIPGIFEFRDAAPSVD